MTESTNNVFPLHRQDVFAVKSWGYKDSFYYYDTEKKCLRFKGEKYPELNGAQFRRAGAFFEKFLKIDVKDLKPPHVYETIPDFKFSHVVCEKFRTFVESKGVLSSMTLEDRYFRSFGQGSSDITKLCHYRIPDIVLWPKSHKEVELIVKSANEHEVVIIPFGGGTNVSCSVNCPEHEQRTIVSLDTTQMNQLLWIDEKSMLACFQSGVGGGALEIALNSKGFTLGHEPDSMEFSTLGGWIATNSSGIKQHSYGNIEGIVIKVKVVTSIGTFEKPCTPRASMGPNIEHLIFGSEGTLGVITEAVVRIHKYPEVRQYGAYFFPTLKQGISFMRECAMKSCLPSSLRLVDNNHVQIGAALTPCKYILVDHLQHFFLNRFKVISDESDWSVAPYLVEGEKAHAQYIEKALKKVANKYGGWFVGFGVGQKTYMSTYTVGYIRDMMVRADCMSDAVETSVVWDKVDTCMLNLSACFEEAISTRGITGYYAQRISQVYHEGVCIYAYVVINSCENQREIFLEIFGLLKETLMRSGGSLSHHHGIGHRGQKVFSKYMPSTAKSVLKAIKNDVDPKNVFGVENLMFNGNCDKIASKL